MCSNTADSSEDVCIEDCFISTGDDLIAIKSGWDEYGIEYGRPSKNITIRRLIGQTQSSAGIAIGSEMSGGVSEVHAENLHFFDSNAAIRIKTSPGRGGYVRNIYVSNMTLSNVKVSVKFTGYYGEHPDEYYDPKALPKIERVTIEDVRGDNVTYAGLLEGIQGDTFQDICLFNISLNIIGQMPWNCSYIQGYSDLICPETCEALREKIIPSHSSDCYHFSSSLKSSGNANRGASLLSW